MNQPEEFLVRLLAEERAIWHPLRSIDWSRKNTPTVMHERRRDFLEKGVRWISGGSEAERKSGERFLRELAAQKLIKPFGRPRRTHVKLLSRGRWIASALADMPGLDIGWLTVREVLEHTRGVARMLVSELMLAGLDNYGGEDCQHQIWAVEGTALPAIVAGWLEATSDSYGRAYYFVTAEGLAASRKPQPTPPDDLPEPDGGAKGLYDEVNLATRQQMRTDAPRNVAELGYIPLTCSPGNTVVAPWNRKPKTTTTPK